MVGISAMVQVLLVSLSVIWSVSVCVVVCRLVVPLSSVYQLNIEYLHFVSSNFPPIVNSSDSHSLVLVWSVDLRCVSL